MTDSAKEKPVINTVVAARQDTTGGLKVKDGGSETGGGDSVGHRVTAVHEANAVETGEEVSQSARQADKEEAVAVPRR